MQWNLINKMTREVGIWICDVMLNHSYFLILKQVSKLCFVTLSFILAKKFLLKAREEDC